MTDRGDETIDDSAEGQEAELDGYRQLTTSSVVALVLGLASPLLLLGSVLLVIPVAALGLGVVALRAIAADPAGRSGRGVAVWGMALAIACIAAAMVRAPLTRVLLTQQARPVAEAWLEAVRRGDLELADSLTQPSRGAGAGAPQPEAPKTLRERVEAVGDLVALEGWEATNYQASLSHTFVGRKYWVVELAFELSREGGGESLRSVIKVLRDPGFDSQPSRWMVNGVQSPVPLADR